MRVLKAALLGSVGILTGLALGYVLWGRQTDTLTAALAERSAEVATMKSWLLDEIEWSDERQERVNAALTKALAELAQARARLDGTKHQVTSPPRALPTRATEVAIPLAVGP